MGQPLITEYEQSLEALSRNEFQDEVSAYLQAVIIDFQVVPSNPQGDAGLDGFSHHGERAYCCYGPEHNAFKQNKDREDAIVDKFKSDLRRLYELDTHGKRLVIKENKEIATILPGGRKIKHVELIVNWFGSHRILSRILTAAGHYAEASECRYIEVECHGDGCRPKTACKPAFCRRSDDSPSKTEDLHPEDREESGDRGSCQHGEVHQENDGSSGNCWWPKGSHRFTSDRIANRLENGACLRSGA